MGRVGGVVRRDRSVGFLYVAEVRVEGDDGFGDDREWDEGGGRPLRRGVVRIRLLLLSGLLSDPAAPLFLPRRPPSVVSVSAVVVVVDSPVFPLRPHPLRKAFGVLVHQPGQHLVPNMFDHPTAKVQHLPTRRYETVPSRLLVSTIPFRRRHLRRLGPSTTPIRLRSNVARDGVQDPAQILVPRTVVGGDEVEQVPVEVEGQVDEGSVSDAFFDGGLEGGRYYVGERDGIAQADRIGLFVC